MLGSGVALAELAPVGKPMPWYEYEPDKKYPWVPADPPALGWRLAVGGLALVLAALFAVATLASWIFGAWFLAEWMVAGFVVCSVIGWLTIPRNRKPRA